MHKITHRGAGPFHGGDQYPLTAKRNNVYAAFSLVVPFPRSLAGFLATSLESRLRWTLIVIISSFSTKSVATFLSLKDLRCCIPALDVTKNRSHDTNVGHRSQMVATSQCEVCLFVGNGSGGQWHGSPPFSSTKRDPAPRHSRNRGSVKPHTHVQTTIERMTQ